MNMNFNGSSEHGGGHGEAFREALHELAVIKAGMLELSHRLEAATRVLMHARAKVPPPSEGAVVVIGRRQVGLTSIQADLYRLLRAHGGFHNTEALATALWEGTARRHYRKDGLPDDGPANIRVHVRNMRRKFADTGVVIRTYRGRGYRLEEPAGVELLL